ncbi:hypothetical protein D1B31_09170 [Neobacillus notoginsengisoli]|uniref:C-type cytochrome biogenesis protein CcmI n=1 Tax=Neobacillus notoginsengisoli TaxID=1578198 RepID=A0A417YUX7_9BACI|nr:hypothetical protein [Neobacillus notoginsengisoli]RHW41103.1 hypothetical protein D1B31_09170 [Neobacillus notoginsengisoli]
MEGISIISILLTAVLVLGCLYLVLMPLFKEESFLDHTKKSQTNAGTKEALLTTLNEIEFEYKMDKMSESDFRQLKKQYETQVAKIMRDEEEAGSKKIDDELMAEVEREIEASLKQKRKKGEGQ